MENRPCPRCGAENNYVTIDKRGVAEIRCRECESYIAKTNATTLYDYFQEQITNIYREQEAIMNAPQEDKPVCKYCTERWAILEGRMGVRPREMNDIKFCPMCGRKLKPTDKDY